MAQLTLESFCRLVDHTLLKSTASEAQIEQLCIEAKTHQFFAVCVNPYHVSRAVRALQSSPVKVATVCDFPLGAGTLNGVLKECEASLSDGADEIDMVLNVSALKDQRFSYLEGEINSLKSLCGNRVLKVILETCLLTPDEIVKACEISKSAGADFVKTSTGFSTGGATVEAVALMRKTFGPGKGVKASGGIRTLEQAQAMVDVGANRLGLSSSLAIVEELKKKEGL